MGLLRYQPYQGLYLLYNALSTIFIRAPIWFIHDLIPYFRPVPTWSLWKALQVRFYRHAAAVSGRIGGLPILNHTSLTSNQQIKGLWVDAAPVDLIVDNLKTWVHIANVQAMPIPGYWLHKSPEVNVGAPPMPGEKVLYFLHGGGYTACSAHPSDFPSHIIKGILRPGIAATVQRSFAIEYRLTTLDPPEPKNPFPTALVDALAGYVYLITQVGFAAEDIIVIGDSAGGNLGLALTTYLVEQQTLLPDNIRKPGHLVLLSPWTDMGQSHRLLPKTDSFYTCQSTDFIEDSYNVKETAFVGPHGLGAAEVNPYISPASKNTEAGHAGGAMRRVSYAKFPRTLILGGGVEMLRDQIRTMAKRMEEVEAGVEFLEFSDSVHDWLALGTEPDTGDALGAIGQWMDKGV
ncbi:Alpha/Beta hydrolase protein [Pterulicium gracile]|uniref:Alpha/Beta hydrolase protein n=1 Tax=Pterulicium gracile TaxID=1884261 RepID=A0A5C3Q8N8_9AGAR|nr:Alpha/Beta hydrolase protein [Pterula gracilis]